MSIHIIYETLCLVNLKIYVGQHNTLANDGYLGSGTILEKAIKKYGKENFQRTTIEFCTSANVNEKETFWIDKLSATDKNIGYNITKGGEGRSDCQGKNNPMYGVHRFGKDNPFYGKKHSDKSKQVIKEKRKLQKFSLEIRMKMSESRQGQNNSNYGNHWNDLQKEKSRILNRKYEYKVTINEQSYIILDLKIFCEDFNLNINGVHSAIILYGGRYKNLQFEKQPIRKKIKNLQQSYFEI